METFQGFYENLLAKVGDPLLMKIFTAFVTLNVNWIYWIGFDKELLHNQNMRFEGEYFFWQRS